MNIITIKGIPKGWRVGQFLFNFLYWLGRAKCWDEMYDPFLIDDKELNRYLKEYIAYMKEHTNKK